MKERVGVTTRAKGDKIDGTFCLECGFLAPKIEVVKKKMVCVGEEARN